MAASQQTQLVRLKAGKHHHFEVMTEPGSVPKWRKQQLGLDNVLQAEVVWTNQAKGERASGSELLEAFETEDMRACILKILEHGEVQLSAAERKEMTERKRKEIVQYIHKYYTDPRSGKPHPTQRIESGLDEIKFHVDLQKPVVNQAQEALKKLPDVLPLKKSEITGTLTVTHAHLGSAQGIISRFAEVKSQDYNGEGCVMQISLVPGDYDAFLGALNTATKGDFQFSIDGHAAIDTKKSDAPAKSSGKQHGRKK